MESREETFMNMALKYMEEYKKTPWWKFKKRRELKKDWYSARECMVRYGSNK